MPFQAQVVRVLIASPGDTSTARGVLKNVCDQWTSMHAEDAGLVLLPSMWERDASPEMGGGAQAVINRQLVDNADVLLGTFWTRLGTPTSEAESGTAEEIDRMMNAGKPVILFFSNEPVVPSSIDTEEYERLQAFKVSVSKAGLVDEYATLDDLRWKAFRALTRTAREHFGASEAVDQEDEPPRSFGPWASLLAHIEREREMTGVSSAGRPRYSTRERLVFENSGSGAAENLTIAVEIPEGVEGRMPTIALPDAPIGRVPAGGRFDVALLRTFGTASPFDIVLRWSEGDVQYETRQSII